MSIHYHSIVSDLMDDLHKYLAYLKNTYNYQITLHQIEQISGQSWLQLLPYNYHQCAVCCEVKSSSSCWRHCIERQFKVRKKAEIAPYIGTCFAGVTEAVFPIQDIYMKCVGFLCVSGYTKDRKMSLERASAAAIKYGLSQNKLRIAVGQLNDQLPNIQELEAQIAPVQTILRLLFYFNSILEEETREYGSVQEKLYIQILKYVNGAFRDPALSLRDICKHFNISYSYASRLFTEFNKLSFSRYVRHIRIEAAKKYLEHTLLPITFTSSECGFSDSNYFSSTFKKETGMTPSEYRENAHQSNSTNPSES
ncbi:MAG: helix-turn-helix transcriptional regulator [Christensenellales bacterium]|jgi:AraC-like DNA-binding protein